MTSLVRVRNLTRTPLRIGSTFVGNVGGTGAATAATVDLNDPGVRRDLARTFPRWVVEPPLNDNEHTILNGNITTMFRENFDRSDIMIDSATALTDGVLTCVSVPVAAGDVVSNITCASGATAGVALLNQFAALYTAPVANAVQSLTIAATGGTFTISFGGQTTAAIAWNATAAAVQAALWLISSITPNGVSVTGTPATATTSGVYRITFTGPNAGIAAATITTGVGSLTGGAATATPAVVTVGSPSTLISQSTDRTSEAWAANTPKTFALASSYTVPDDGYVIAAINIHKTTTLPSLVGSSVIVPAAAVGYTPNQIRLSFTSGSGLTATAPATLLAPAGQAVIPYVVLT